MYASKMQFSATTLIDLRRRRRDEKLSNWCPLLNKSYIPLKLYIINFLFFLEIGDADLQLVFIKCVLGRLFTLSKDFERLFLQPSVINHPRDPDESPHIQNAVIVSSAKTNLIKRVVMGLSSLRAGVYGSVRGKRRQPSIRERVTRTMPAACLRDFI